MDSTSHIVLGKRGRHMSSAEQLETDALELPKRSRARRIERVEIDSEIDLPNTKHHNGLLTPEPSTLTESQQRPAPAPSELALDAAPNAANPDVFPFMKLPAELRLHIYHMALVRHSPIPLHVERAPEKPDDDDEPVSSPSTVHQITTTVIQNTAPAPPLRRSPRQQLPPLPREPPTDNDDTSDRPIRITNDDPVVPVLLRLNQQIYKEARQLLYSENIFTLSLTSGIYTLSTLHQRSRSLIKHVVLTIPSHHDILDGFADLVRLGLRYCWGLKSFRIILQASLPDDGRIGGATSVYANAFHILRWLPRGCSVVLDGCVGETVRKVVAEEGRLMNVLDEVCLFLVCYCRVAE
jgi:epsin